MSRTIHVFDYLKAPDRHQPAAVTVVFGDEPFLKRLALNQIRHALAAQDDVPFASFEGGSVEWRDVLDEISTVALFGGGGPRLAIVEQADSFVTKHRARLEAYVSHPKTSGVLVLEVAAWASNTRLYKALDNSGLQIECRAPEKMIGRRKVADEKRLAQWLAAWAQNQHQVTLQPAASQLLLELVGPHFGLLDQDLAKLALFTQPGGQITAEMVRDVVGGWRTKTVWEMVDAAADGNAAEALEQLDHLLQSGEHALALFGQISWSLRRFAAATRIFQQSEREGRPVRLGDAMQQAGFRNWPAGALPRAERQLRQLGRQRSGQLYQWLLEADLALKGTHSHPHRARLMLEKLFVRLAAQLAPQR